VTCVVSVLPPPLAAGPRSLSGIDDQAGALVRTGLAVSQRPQCATLRACPFLHAAVIFLADAVGVVGKQDKAGVTVTKPGKEGGKVYSDYDWDGKSMGKSGERPKSDAMHVARLSHGAQTLHAVTGGSLVPRTSNTPLLLGRTMVGTSSTTDQSHLWHSTSPTRAQ
jgi:hypothetical protein